MGPRDSHHRASSSSSPAKNAGSMSPVSREEPMSWATSDPHQTHHGYMVREVVTTPIARTCSGNSRRPSRARSLRTEKDSRRCPDTAHLSGDTTSDGPHASKAWRRLRALRPHQSSAAQPQSDPSLQETRWLPLAIVESQQLLSSPSKIIAISWR